MKRFSLVALPAVAAAVLVAANPCSAALGERSTSACNPFAGAAGMPFGEGGPVTSARLAGTGAAAGVAEPYVERAYRRELEMIRSGEEVPVTRGARRGSAITIPVEFHVIQPNAGTGVVTDGKIAEQIAVLNDSFDGGSPVGGADTGLRFELASTERVINPAWWNLDYNDAASKRMKNELHEGGTETLNLYTSQLDDDYLGWATFPALAKGSSGLDGVIVEWRSLPGGSLTDYSDGDTAVHEVGHWAGLYHTFEGSPDGCAAPGDLVDDTPYERVETEGCPVGKDTCPAVGLDPIENFMDYSYDPCMHEFTAGQGDRMNSQFTRYRADGAVELRARARKRQRLDPITVKGSCGGEGCEVSAGGKIVAKPKGSAGAVRVALGKESGESPPGRKAKLRLAASRGDRGEIERILDRGGSASARVWVSAVDGSGNRASDRLRVRLKR